MNTVITTITNLTFIKRADSFLNLLIKIKRGNFIIFIIHIIFVKYYRYFKSNS